MPKTIALRFAAAILSAMTGSALMSNAARSADLRLPPKPVAQQQDTTEARNQLFEEFLRWLKKHNQ
jgi:hypothetical protein